MDLNHLDLQVQPEKLVDVVNEFRDGAIWGDVIATPGGLYEDCVQLTRELEFVVLKLECKSPLLQLNLMILFLLAVVLLAAFLKILFSFDLLLLEHKLQLAPRLL